MALQRAGNASGRSVVKENLRLMANRSFQTPCSGAWVFRGTRLPVATIFENLEDGLTIEEIMEQFDVTREQVTAVLDFAARSLEAPIRR